MRRGGGIESYCFGDVVYRWISNNNVIGSSNGVWNLIDGEIDTPVTTTAITSGYSYLVNDAATYQGGNSRIRIGGSNFPATLYLGYQNDRTVGTQVGPACFHIKTNAGANNIPVISISHLYLGNARLDQWKNSSNDALYSSDVVLTGRAVLEEKVTYNGQWYDGENANFRNLYLASELSGSGSFTMIDSHQGFGVTLLGNNTDLGAVQWNVERGILTVGWTENRVKTQLLTSAADSSQVQEANVTPNASRLGTGSVVWLKPQKDSRVAVEASLIFRTPAGTTSDNSTVDVFYDRANAGDQDSAWIEKYGSGKAILRNVGTADSAVPRIQVYEGTLDFGTEESLAAIFSDTVQIGVYTVTDGRVNEPIGQSSTTIYGSLTTKDLDVGVNNKWGTGIPSSEEPRNLTTTFRMVGDLLKVDNPSASLSWGCKTATLNGTDTANAEDNHTVVDLSGVKNVEMNVQHFHLAYAAGAGVWDGSVNVKFGEKNRLTADTFRLNDGETAGLYQISRVDFGQETELNINDIYWGVRKSGNLGTTAGAEVTLAEGGKLTIQGRGGEGSKANLRIADGTTDSGLISTARINFSNAGELNGHLGTLSIGYGLGRTSTDGLLRLGDHANIEADSILLATREAGSTGSSTAVLEWGGDSQVVVGSEVAPGTFQLGNHANSNATLRMSGGELEIYGNITEMGRSVMELGGRLRIHLMEKEQLESPLIQVDELTLKQDARFEVIFSDEVPIQSGLELVVLETAGLPEVENWADYFSDTFNHYFQLSTMDGQLLATVDSAAVPEPGTWSLLLLGLLSWYGYGRGGIQKRK